eukprot:1058130-Pyramimonas_sp.AAC.1
MGAQKHRIPTLTTIPSCGRHGCPATLLRTCTHACSPTPAKTRYAEVLLSPRLVLLRSTSPHILQ